MRLETIKALHDDNCSMTWPVTERAQSDRIKFARAIEQAATRAALEGAISALNKRVTGDKSEGDFETMRCIEAIRDLLG